MKSGASAPSLRFLTGITTSGTPHLGNYVGAIRPAVRASRMPGTEHFYFLADYHALVKCDDPARVARSTLEIAAAFVASGLDPEQVYLYRQSDLPEVTELTWMLTCVTGKGVLNRAHAYKAAAQSNAEAGTDTDDGVTAGLFMYPVLMAADILLFNADVIPVGRDQVQHIEMTRHIAQAFNHLYGEHFRMPSAQVDDQVELLPGTDGRKMSKSYDNTVPLFAPRAELRKAVMAIVTDSRAPGEPKETAGSTLFQLYQAFASADETAALARDFAGGIAWGEAKERVFARVDAEIAPLRARYEHLMAHPAEVEAILERGARKARALSAPFIARLRSAVGLRSLAAADARPTPTDGGGKRAARPAFKQWREADGRHHAKLVDASGRALLSSPAFDSPRDAGLWVGAVRTAVDRRWPLSSSLGAGIDDAEVRAALDALGD